MNTVVSRGLNKRAAGHNIWNCLTFSGGPWAILFKIDYMIICTLKFKRISIYQSCAVLVFYQDSDCRHPVAICFLNTLLLECSHTHICLCISCDCFHAVPEELRNSQNLNYALTERKKFAQLRSIIFFKKTTDQKMSWLWWYFKVVLINRGQVY